MVKLRDGFQTGYGFRFRRTLLARGRLGARRPAAARRRLWGNRRSLLRAKICRGNPRSLRRNLHVRQYDGHEVCYPIARKQRRLAAENSTREPARILRGGGQETRKGGAADRRMATAVIRRHAQDRMQPVGLIDVEWQVQRAARPGNGLAVALSFAIHPAQEHVAAQADPSGGVGTRSRVAAKRGVAAAARTRPRRYRPYWTSSGVTLAASAIGARLQSSLSARRYAHST